MRNLKTIDDLGILQLIRKLQDCRISNKINRLKKEILQEEITEKFKKVGINLNGNMKQNPLTYKQRVCLGLYFLGCPVKDIADTFNVHPTSIYAHYQKACNKLNAQNPQTALSLSLAKGYLSIEQNFYQSDKKPRPMSPFSWAEI